jgi:hypothetical protein
MNSNLLPLGGAVKAPQNYNFTDLHIGPSILIFKE